MPDAGHSTAGLYLQIPEEPEYRKHQQEFLNIVRSLAGEIPWNPDLYFPYPVIVNQNLASRLSAFCHALHQGLRAVVEHYLDDPRIRRRLPLSDFLQGILAAVRHRPYRLGTYRPDILFDLEGEFRVCEINARFPTNGLVMSQVLAQAASQFSYITDVKLHGSQELPRAPVYFQQLFNREKPSAVVRQSEDGCEVFIMLDKFLKLQNYKVIRPEQVKLEKDRLFCHGVDVSQFILELDREELADFSPDVLAHLLENCTCINDVRTLILVHDKRMLGVLADRSIMSSYLDDETCSLLQRHLIDTIDLADSVENTAQLVSNRDAWILKPCSGGRGIGMYIGRETSHTKWEELLREKAHLYCAQPFIEQCITPLDPVAGHQGNPELKLVGCLPCIDDHMLGPGMFRGATGGVINLQGGRGELFPFLFD